MNISRTTNSMLMMLHHKKLGVGLIDEDPCHCSSLCYQLCIYPKQLVDAYSSFLLGARIAYQTHNDDSRQSSFPSHF